MDASEVIFAVAIGSIVVCSLAAAGVFGRRER